MNSSPIRLRRTAVIGVASLPIVACASNPSSLKDASMNQDRKTQVTLLLKAIETGAPEPVAIVNPAKYVQHNLAVGDGLAGFAAALKALPAGSTKVNTVRVFQDGAWDPVQGGHFSHVSIAPDGTVWLAGDGLFRLVDR